MSANAIFNTSRRFTALQRSAMALVMFSLLLMTPAVSRAAGDEEEAEHAVATLMAPLEKAGFDFRADVWERELKPDIGKAVRVQLFKGNDYRVCVAVPQKGGVKIEAHVLDASGKPVEEKVDDRGWGEVLTVKPKRTGVYVVAISQAGGKGRIVTCAMIMGYR